MLDAVSRGRGRTDRHKALRPRIVALVAKMLEPDGNLVPDSESKGELHVLATGLNDDDTLDRDAHLQALEQIKKFEEDPSYCGVLFAILHHPGWATLRAQAAEDAESRA